MKTTARWAGVVGCMVLGIAAVFAGEVAEEAPAADTAKPADSTATADKTDAKEATTTQASVEIMGLSVMKSLSQGESQGFYYSGNVGTQVKFRVEIPNKQIISVNETKSKLILFADDKETAFATQSNWLNSNRTSNDGKVWVLSLNSRTLPAEKAQTLKLKADICVVCGSGEAVIEEPDVAIMIGTKMTKTPFPIEIEGMGKANWGNGKMYFELSAPQSFDAIRKLEVISGGKTMTAESNGGGSSGRDGQQLYTRRYTISDMVQKATFRFTILADQKEVTIPIDVTVGIGL